jgi:hypothetical protein
MKRKQGRPVANKHKVPQKMWNQWSNLGKKVFNQVYYEMRPRQQWAYLHPQAKPHPVVHWNTTRYNAAVIAADAASGEPPLSGVIVVKAKRKRK